MNVLQNKTSMSAAMSGHEVRPPRAQLMPSLRRVAQQMVSPALRLSLKRLAASAREQAYRACVWRWEAVALSAPSDKPYRFVHLGRRANRAETLFRFAGTSSLERNDESTGTVRTAPAAVVLIGDLRTPGSLRVPVFVHSVVPLRRPIEEILGSFDNNLRRTIRQQQVGCEVRQATSDADIDFADQVMLRPYATARHGPTASQLAPELVRKMARRDGRLDILYQHGEAVACNLCHASVRDGKTYWTGMRAGYPEPVFSDQKRLSQVNTINAHLGMLWAHANDFDYFDFGMSIGSPDDGMLRWKKARGAHVDTSLTNSYFYVRLPKSGTAQLLWDSPLFSTSGKLLTLHIGLPADIADDVAALRYRDMSYGGLQRVCLHRARPVSEALIEALRKLFTKPHHGTVPTFETIAVGS